MKKTFDKIELIYGNNYFGYTISVLFSTGKRLFLSEFAEEENTISFAKLKEIISSMSLDELYSLKDRVSNAYIVIGFIESELRRRHKALNRPKSNITSDIKTKDEIVLPDGQTLIKASKLKERN